MGFHGGFGSAEQMENHYHLNEFADKNGFIMVYADGVGDPILNIQTWNGGACCGYAMKQKVDDVGFVDALIDQLIVDYSIDTTMVYATGMSNGAFMCYRLACELSHRITAIAPVAGSMGVDLCQPTNPVSIIHIHSAQDDHIPYEGGVGNGVSKHYNPPLDSVFDVWAELNETDPSQVIQDDDEYLLKAWPSGKCGSSIQFYLTTDGGHSWPGGEKPTQFADDPSKYINAGEVMWAFFKTKKRNCPTGTQEINKTWNTPPFPNPFANSLHINCEDKTLISIYSLAGSLCYQKTINQSQEIDLGHLPDALYLVHLESKHGISRFKVQKAGE